jgi:predicted dinucleotide-binding enzyme
MKIGIIGAGQIGGTLARRLAKLGHSVSIANSRGPASLATLAVETGAKAVSVADAAQGADLVVVTIPQKSVPLLPKDLFRDVPAEVIVVDTGNYYPSFRDGTIAEIESGLTESGWVAKHLGRPVLKVFNNIMAHSLAEGGLPPGAKGRIALPVAGDDPRAKAVVMGLVDALGFDGIDAGSLDESWRQQPGTPVYCTDYDADGVRRALSRAERVRSPELRESSIAKMQGLPAGSTPRDIVNLVRAMHEA